MSKWTELDFLPPNPDHGILGYVADERVPYGQTWAFPTHLGVTADEAWEIVRSREELKTLTARAEQEGALQESVPTRAAELNEGAGYDMINPSHYKFANGAELIDIIETLPYNRAAAIKYLARAGKKPIADELEDYEKALWYINREVQRIERTRAAQGDS